MGNTAVRGLDLTAEPGVQEITITRVFDAPRERVFDRLYRVDDPQVVVPGIGLGLYMSRQLVQAFGGTLVVESSTPGAGSVFALSLPLSRTTTPDQLREEEPTPRTARRA